MEPTNGSTSQRSIPPLFCLKCIFINSGMLRFKHLSEQPDGTDFVHCKRHTRCTQRRKSNVLHSFQYNISVSYFHFERSNTVLTCPTITAVHYFGKHTSSLRCGIFDYNGTIPSLFLKTLVAFSDSTYA